MNRHVIILALTLFSTMAKADSLDKSKICGDLYSYACLDQAGNLKAKDDSRKSTLELFKVVKEGREKVARAMGFKSTDEALIRELEKSGIKLRDPLNPKILDILKHEPYADEGEDRFGRQLSKEVDECYLKAEQVPKPSREQMSKMVFENLVIYNAQNLAGFVNDYGAVCSEVKDSPSLVDPKDNAEISERCSQFHKLKNEAELLFRLRGSPQYKTLSEKFVRQNQLPATVFKDSKENEKVQAEIDGPCNSLSRAIYWSAAVKSNDLLLKFSQNKILVDHVVANYYSVEKKKKFEAYLQSQKNQLGSILDRVIDDPIKRKKVSDGYKNIKFDWPEDLNYRHYKKSEKDGMYYLDFDALSAQQAKTYEGFISVDLTEFTEINASYSPRLAQGEQETPESINVLPAFLVKMNDNPEMFLSVLGHELAHKVGPKVGERNGHSLKAELAGPLSCLKQRDSIFMQNQQSEEASSDLFSAEMIADQMKNFKSEAEKFEYLSRSMQSYCGFDFSENENFSVRVNGVHPIPATRISGIFGANTSVRKALGCNQASSHFKTCGLDSPLEKTFEPEWNGEPQINTESDAKAKSQKARRAR